MAGRDAAGMPVSQAILARTRLCASERRKEVDSVPGKEKEGKRDLKKSGKEKEK